MPSITHTTNVGYWPICLYMVANGGGGAGVGHRHRDCSTHKGWVSGGWSSLINMVCGQSRHPPGWYSCLVHGINSNNHCLREPLGRREIDDLLCAYIVHFGMSDNMLFPIFPSPKSTIVQVGLLLCQITLKNQAQWGGSRGFNIAPAAPGHKPPAETSLRIRGRYVHSSFRHKVLLTLWGVWW